MRETMKKKNKIRFSFTRKPEPGSHRQRKAPHSEEEEGWRHTIYECTRSGLLEAASFSVLYYK
jgi:hypothetical protein